MTFQECQKLDYQLQLLVVLSNRLKLVTLLIKFSLSSIQFLTYKEKFFLIIKKIVSNLKDIIVFLQFSVILCCILRLIDTNIIKLF